MTVNIDFGFVPGDPMCFDKLSLINRGIAVHLGRPVEQVCNRKETTYENHVVRFRLSVRSESRVEPEIHS